MPGIILYDGICPLCRGIVAFIRKHDYRNRFRYVPQQSEEGERLITATQLAEHDRNTAIYLKEDKCFIRSTAVLHILKDLGSGWSLFYIFIIIPVSIRDSVYRYIARNRHRWAGKLHYHSQ